jgi:hypothetical protein
MVPFAGGAGKGVVERLPFLFTAGIPVSCGFAYVNDRIKATTRNIQGAG